MRDALRDRGYQTRRLVHLGALAKVQGPLTHTPVALRKFSMRDLAKMSADVTAAPCFAEEPGKAAYIKLMSSLIELQACETAEQLAEVEPRNWAPANAEPTQLSEPLTEAQAYPQDTHTQPLSEQQAALSCAAQAPPAPPHRRLPGSKSCWALMRSS